MNKNSKEWKNFLKRAQEGAKKRARAAENTKRATANAIRAYIEEQKLLNEWKKRHGKN